MWLIILLIIVGIVYFASMQGITCCNSGSLYALVKAIVKDKKLSINKYSKYTKYMDYAKVGNNYYTDRPPGTSFAAVPFYVLGLNVTLVSVISGILSTALVYLITLQLVANPIISFFTGLIFAFCTINWRYSTTFILHSLSTFLVLLSVYGLFTGFPIFIIGLVLGLATIVEYTDFIYFAGIAITKTIFGSINVVPELALGYVVGVFPLLLYNKKCFGSLFATSYKYSAHFKWSNSFKTTFVNPIFKGIKGLLFHIKKKDKLAIPGGVLTLSPVLIFGMIGFYFLPLEELVLFLFLTLPLFLLIAKHKTWWAGGGGDHRYLSSLIPYLTIPIGLTIKNLVILWPAILFFSLISLLMVISKMLALTVTPKDLEKIDLNLFKKIKKKRSSLLEFVNYKYWLKVIPLIFRGLFVRKIHLEKEINRAT